MTHTHIFTHPSAVTYRWAWAINHVIWHFFVVASVVKGMIEWRSGLTALGDTNKKMDATFLQECKYSREQRGRDALKDGVRKQKKEARLMGELGGKSGRD